MTGAAPALLAYLQSDKAPEEWPGLGALIGFLENETAPDIGLFVKNAIARTRFNVAVARAMGLDAGWELGFPAIIRRRTAEGAACALIGYWDGPGDYVRNVQHTLDHLLPADASYMLVRPGLSRVGIDLEPADGDGGIYATAPTEARAMLLAVLRREQARRG